jgi:hypothetical protein
VVKEISHAKLDNLAGMKNICAILPLFLVVIVSLVLYMLLIKQAAYFMIYDTEPFIEAPRVSLNTEQQVNSTDKTSCKVLVDAIQNDEVLKNVMAKKLVAVRNDGDSFRYFNDKNVTFNANRDYCYVSTFDYVKQDGAPVCDKSIPTYNFKMVEDVQMGAVMENGDKLPRQVCIMKLSRPAVNSSDVRQFSNHVNNFDNRIVMDKVDECTKALNEKSNQYNTLMDEHKKLQEQANKSMDAERQCSSQTNSFVHQNTLLNAAVMAAIDNIVIIDSHNIQSQLIIKISMGFKSVDIPSTFNIGYIYMPEYFKVKIIRNDGSFTVIDRTTSSYPMVETKMGENVKKIEVIFPPKST